MKFLEVKSWEMPEIMAQKYAYRLFSRFTFYKILYKEEVVLASQPPLWFRLTKWFVQKTCKHHWVKSGRERLEGYFLRDSNTWVQDFRCDFCGLETYKKHTTYDLP